MPLTSLEIEKLLNAVAARLPLVESTNLSPLGQCLTDLQSLGQERWLPGALQTLIRRAAKLAEHIIMAETDFDAGLKKLGESVAKMLRGIGTLVEGGDEGCGADAAAAPEGGKLDESATSPAAGRASAQASQETSPSAVRDSRPRELDSEEMADDLVEMIRKFASGLPASLEDFEAYILEYEKGNPYAQDAIKRTLHTWKGEFGILGLPQIAALIHDIEEQLAQESFSPDILLRFKDFLLQRSARFTERTMQCVGDEERTAIFGQTAAPLEVPSAAARAADAACPQPAAVVEPPPSRELFCGDPSMMGDFLTESRDHVHSAETMLLELETNPESQENIDSIFRAWHTIKGVAGFLGLKEINALSHSMESLIDKVRKREMAFEAGHIDLLLACNDCLKEFLNRIEAAMNGSAYQIPADYGQLMARLKAPGGLSPAQPRLVRAEKKLGEILVESGSVPAEAVVQALSAQQRGDARKLGTILIEDQQVPARAVATALASQVQARQSRSLEETIRVPVNRIDQLVDLIGEAVIAQSMINADAAIDRLADQALSTKIAHANMVMRQIQEMAMSLRMVSIKSTFQKMARLARDLGKKFERDIDFLTEGEDTELDKSVVENIGDPLIHMIRNSIDHGIEPAAERQAGGKSARARILLRAYHRAGSIFIEVSDDGRGLNREAIMAKAVSRGLAKAEERLTDQEIFQFIFLPGFSTAKTVTDVSGRGVGMDVVKRNIEALRGSIEITSVWGTGTTFTIRLPLTLAIVDGMIVRAGSATYILPTLAIVESIKPRPEQVTTVMNRGRSINLRGELITLVHLETVLGHNGQPWDAQSGVVMIVEDMLGKKVGLHVDEIVGQQQVVIKSLGSGIGDVPGVTGGAIMSDGNVSLILDVAGIVRMATE
jgi:two-component system chemotaxis sensor kinase CheA